MNLNLILSFAAEFTSGFAAAGALLEAGVLTVKQTVMALVIGNDAYQQVPKLQKAVNDARAVGDTLKDIGFEVAVIEGLSGVRGLDQGTVMDHERVGET